MKFENKPQIGNGFYTITEVAQILRLPYKKVAKWVSEYWDGNLGKTFEGKYSWSIENSRAVSFHTLVELYVLVMLADAGVTTKEVLKAHKELSKFFNTPFPFAQKNVLENIKTDSKKIFFNLDGDMLSLDGTKQLNLSIIKVFFRNLDFGNDAIATRLWPLGREKNIVVDPERQFGHPVIGKTNIYPEAIYSLYKGGEPINFIAFSYDISEKDVKDALEYCKAAA